MKWKQNFRTPNFSRKHQFELKYIRKNLTNSQPELRAEKNEIELFCFPKKLYLYLSKQVHLGFCS